MQVFRTDAAARPFFDDEHGSCARPSPSRRPEAHALIAAGALSIPLAFSNRRFGCISNDEIGGVLIILPIDLEDRLEIAQLLQARLRLETLERLCGLPVARFGQCLRRQDDARLSPRVAARFAPLVGRRQANLDLRRAGRRRGGAGRSC